MILKYDFKSHAAAEISQVRQKPFFINNQTRFSGVPLSDYFMLLFGEDSSCPWCLGGQTIEEIEIINAPKYLVYEISRLNSHSPRQEVILHEISRELCIGKNWYDLKAVHLEDKKHAWACVADKLDYSYWYKTNDSIIKWDLFTNLHDEIREYFNFAVYIRNEHA